MPSDTPAATLPPPHVSIRTPKSVVPLRLLWALAPLWSLTAVGLWVGFPEVVARLANDDQAYYIMVARNLFVRGPTYDGLYLTNGVHPLFAAVLGAVYSIFSVPFAQLAATSILTCVCLGSGFLYVLLCIRPLELSTRVGLAALLGSLAIFPVLYRGMEGALSLLVMGLYVAAVARRHPGFWLATVLSVALWTARLELLALPPIVLILAGRALPLRPEERATLLKAWVASICAFGLFAAASYYWIGLALPVSGLIKQDNAVLLPYFCVLGLSGAAVSSVGLLVPRVRGLARRVWMTHSVLTFAAVFYLSHAWGQADTQQQTWYYFPIPAVAAIALVELEAELRASLRGWIAGVLGVAALLAAVWEGMFVIPLRAASWRAMLPIASRAKQAALPGERFMGPGWMTLLVGPEFEPFSQDGLVGGVKQYHAIREDRLLQFAYESGVRFMFMSSSVPRSVVPRLPPPWTMSFVSEGTVPNGRSFWAWVSGDDHGCGVGECQSYVSVFRLSPGAESNDPGLTEHLEARSAVVPAP